MMDGKTSYYVSSHYAKITCIIPNYDVFSELFPFWAVIKYLI